MLYRRRECAACDRAAEALASISSTAGLEWLERSVDGDAALEADYGQRVPVIVLDRGGETLELAAERIGPAALARRLRAVLNCAH